MEKLFYCNLRKAENIASITVDNDYESIYVAAKEDGLIEVKDDGNKINYGLYTKEICTIALRHKDYLIFNDGETLFIYRVLNQYSKIMIGCLKEFIISLNSNYYFPRNNTLYIYQNDSNNNNNKKLTAINLETASKQWEYDDFDMAEVYYDGHVNPSEDVFVMTHGVFLTFLQISATSTTPIKSFPHAYSHPIARLCWLDDEFFVGGVPIEACSENEHLALIYIFSYQKADNSFKAIKFFKDNILSFYDQLAVYKSPCCHDDIFLSYTKNTLQKTKTINFLNWKKVKLVKTFSQIKYDNGILFPRKNLCKNPFYCFGLQKQIIEKVCMFPNEMKTLSLIFDHCCCDNENLFRRIQYAFLREIL